jgi:hypothetical protein
VPGRCVLASLLEIRDGLERQTGAVTVYTRRDNARQVSSAHSALSHRPLKRARLETLPHSETCMTLLDGLGRGSTHVSTAVVIAGSTVREGIASEALRCLASLGGAYKSNQERDLHNWTRGLFGFQLEPFYFKMKLQQVSGATHEVDVPFFLPHEMLHAIWEFSPLVFAQYFSDHGCSTSFVDFWHTYLAGAAFAIVATSASGRQALACSTVRMNPERAFTLINVEFPPCRRHLPCTVARPFF